MNQENSASTNFIIHTPVYEGPFELVLELIEKHKLLVNELFLASITDDFVMYVRAQKAFPLDETTSFISIAATLLLIKSRSLIPDFTLSEEEENDVKELKYRLQQYKYIKEAAYILHKNFMRTPLLARETPILEPIFSPGNDCTLSIISKTLSVLLINQKKQNEQTPKTTLQKTISLAETVNRLATRVHEASNISFNEFSGFKHKQKITVIISFLALLELIKQGSVNAIQHNSNGDIRIISTQVDIPKYGVL